MQHLLTLAIQAAIQAGNTILSVYDGPEATRIVLQKENDTPLTIADQKAHAAICGELRNTPYPLLSEEGKDIPFTERSAWKRFWMVDPLDGTKEFLKRNGQFTVNIALIEDAIPVLGVIYQPTEDLLYYAAQGIGACKCTAARRKWKNSLPLLIGESVKLPVERKTSAYTIVASRSHLSDETQKFIEKLRNEHGKIETVSVGSSLKICMVAEGSADIYPRFAPTMEWDTAAGDAIARCAGKHILHSETAEPLRYNKPNLLNDWFIVK
ncbi:MAG: 3'(2'),5'-bisphosphate nucleotidase CysQ [Bacteroidales bacterium]|nr:3'(2'),5'-bisphosphate nucleotidase CysQ [Bacteroidales bacterium]